MKSSKNGAFTIGALLLACTLCVDLWMLMLGLNFVGIISLISTFLVFSASLVWLIYQNDKRLHLRSWWLAIPLVLCAFGVNRALSVSNVVVMNTAENLSEVGNLLMARYQLGLWLASVLIFFGFVIGASLMVSKRRAG